MSYTNPAPNGWDGAALTVLALIIGVIYLIIDVGIYLVIFAGFWCLYTSLSYFILWLLNKQCPVTAAISGTIIWVIAAIIYYFVG